MNNRYSVATMGVVAMLAGLVIMGSALARGGRLPVFGDSQLAIMEAGGAVVGAGSASQAVYQSSEHYRLAGSELGDVLATMRSGSFSLNQGLAVEAEGAPSMVSESYRVGGIIRYWHSLPLVLKRYI